MYLWWQELRLELRLSWFPDQILHNYSFAANCTNGMFPGWISETSKGKTNNGNHFRKTWSLPLRLQVHDFGIILDGGDLNNKKGNQQVHAVERGKATKILGRDFFGHLPSSWHILRDEKSPKWFILRVGHELEQHGHNGYKVPFPGHTHTVSQGTNLNSKHEDIPLHVQKTKDKNSVLRLPTAVKINCHIKLLIPTKWSYTIYQLKDRANSLVV